MLIFNLHALASTVNSCLRPFIDFILIGSYFLLLLLGNELVKLQRLNLKINILLIQRIYRNKLFINYLVLLFDHDGPPLFKMDCVFVIAAQATDLPLCRWILFVA